MTSHATTSARSQSTIRIFDITVRLNARRTLQSVRISVDDIEKPAKDRKVGKDAIVATFQPPLDVSSSDQLALRIRSSFPLSISEKDIPVNIPADQLLDCHPNGQGQQEWKQSFDKAEITICLSHEGTSQPSGFPLIPDNTTPFPSTASSGILPTTDEITSICPRFRILVAGRTGVGKSSLINGAFGVRDALVSDAKAGKADINQEIFSNENKRFVLHDSQGFEPGEVSNFTIVRDFINTRNQMPELKDKLHAIWICIAIPPAGGRVIETGLEKLFEEKKKGDLGDVPIIVVFTKLDAVVDREERILGRDSQLKEEEIPSLARQKADEAIQKDCLDIFQKTVGLQVPCKAISTKKGYESTLSDLIQATFDHVKEHVAKEASVVTAIAQRISPSVKIQGSIEVGKRKYWAGLATGINFPGKTLEACLDVIHTDIINVWNQEDPHGYLNSKDFKAMMSNLVGDILEEDSAAGDNAGVGRVLNPTTGLNAGLDMLGKITGVVGGLSGPAAPIILPIVGCLVLAKWVYDVYKASQQNLEHMMAYIVDLTLIMQNIFWLAEGKHPTSRRMIKLAFNAYYDSPAKADVHEAIVEHVKKSNSYAPGARDLTLDKLVKIIVNYNIDSTEMWKLREDIPSFDAPGPDEPWETKPKSQSFRR